MGLARFRVGASGSKPTASTVQFLSSSVLWGHHLAGNANDEREQALSDAGGRICRNRAAYILLSTRLASSLSASVAELETIERFKGIAFVTLTGLGLFLAARLVLRRFGADAAEAARAREALLLSERTALAGLFVSSIAHDANNTAAVVMSALAGMEEERLDDLNRQALADAQAAMATLVKLFKDLKEMGRSRSSAALILSDLRELVERSVALLRGHSALKHCRVRIEAPATLSLPVFPLLVDQVLVNLLLNASDATEGHGLIEVRLCTLSGEVRLEVHDDGKGVPPEGVAGLFSPFSTTKPHGTGLGLVSVQECARAHGGRVEYARSPLGGARFSVCIPLPGNPQNQSA